MEDMSTTCGVMRQVESCSCLRIMYVFHSQYIAVIRETANEPPLLMVYCFPVCTYAITQTASIVNHLCTCLLHNVFSYVNVVVNYRHGRALWAFFQTAITCRFSLIVIFSDMYF